MNHKRGQFHLPILVLILLMLASCVSQPATPEVVLEPSQIPSESQPEEEAAVSEPEVVVEPLPSATMAPPPPTRTPFPTSSPVPTLDFPELTGDYLGQELPGLTPELFAPGIVSVRMNPRGVAISPDGTELYYSIGSIGFSIILWMRQVDGIWTLPEAAPFSGVYSDLDPAFMPDGPPVLCFKSPH